MSKNKKRGWFRSAEDDERDESFEMAGPNGSVSAAAAPEGPPAPIATPVTGEGGIDVAAIFDAAGVPREDRDRVERARALLQALPGGVSAEVRRQIVEASLTTFGVATERITEAAHKETEALERFIASNQQATNRGQEEARARVQALEQEIFRVRQAADQAAAAHEMRIRAANNEMVGVNQVLSFFGGAAVVVTDVELDEPTEDRSDWTALPVSPPSRSAKEKVSRPPPIRPREPSGSTPPAPAPASDPSGRTPSS